MGYPVRSIFVAVVVFALSPACSGGGSGGTGGGSAGTGGGSTAAGGGSSAAGGGSSAAGGGSAASGGGTSAAGGGTSASGGGGGSSAAGGGSQTDAGSDPQYTMEAGQCFTFATKTIGSNNGQDCGDWLGLAGANVDISGIGSNLCQLTGTYASLSAVPTDYSACSWVSYIEGLNGLTNAGIFVRDAATMNHHYRVHVISNSPTLIFNFSTVD